MTTKYQIKRVAQGMLLLALTTGAFASGRDIRATIDGQMVNFPDTQPVMINSRVMVPLRGAFEHMNAVVTWDESAQAVHTTLGKDEIHLPIGSYSAMVNGKPMGLDSPARIYDGRTMVPLRFRSEALHASVEWLAPSRTVEITTARLESPIVGRETTSITFAEGTVLPFTLNQALGSKTSSAGDMFRATIDGAKDVPAGTILEGRIDAARAKSGNTPGVLGLDFDRLRLPDGQTIAIVGTLIGLDADSVMMENGHLVAKSPKVNDTLKWVGYGAGAGALLSILTKGNLISNTLIGSALGLLYAEIQKDPAKAKDVDLDAGTKFGVRLTKELSMRVPVSSMSKQLRTILR